VRLLVAAEAVDVSFEVVTDFQNADYLKTNPAGQVPALRDGEDVVLESAAIMEYLVAKKELPGHWVGRTPLERARVSEYLHWHHTHLRRAASAFYKTFFADGGDVDIDPELKVLEDSLKYVETHFLAKSKFIGSDEISIADLQFASELIQAHFGRLLHDLFEFPKVAALMQAVHSLPNNAFSSVFKELAEFQAALPAVKSAQVTIRGNREMLKGLQKARPKRHAK
jgi:glutathione S-transferase